MFVASRAALFGFVLWMGSAGTAHAASEAAKPEASKAEVAKDTNKAEAGKSDAGKSEAGKSEVGKSEGAPKLPARAAVSNDKTPQPSEIQRQFCFNNAASANDARLAWQASQLTELEGRLKQRIADLEAKRAEYVDWVRKRDEAMSKAADNVVVIYARMKPDAAALQIAAMDDAMAAALLAKLNVRNASAILNEMEPGRAARLTNAMVGPTGSDKKKT